VAIFSQKKYYVRKKLDDPSYAERRLRVGTLVRPGTGRPDYYAFPFYAIGFPPNLFNERYIQQIGVSQFTIDQFGARR
jgi:hypothetical protein